MGSKSIRLLVICMSLLIFSPKGRTTNYVYPNAQAGYTLFTPGSGISSSDTLSFNGDFSAGGNPFVVITNDVPTISNIISPTIVNATCSATAIVLSTNSSATNFTLPSNIIWNANGTGVQKVNVTTTNTLFNQGTLNVSGSGFVFGIDASSEGIQINNSGAINASTTASSGVLGIYSISSTTNSGNISAISTGSAAAIGTFINNGASFTNSNMISASSSGGQSTGLILRNSSSLTNSNSGTITAGNTGVSLQNSNLTNSGSISATLSSGVGVLVSASNANSSVTNNGGGTISGVTAGVKLNPTLTNTATLNNTGGTITGGVSIFAFNSAAGNINLSSGAINGNIEVFQGASTITITGGSLTGSIENQGASTITITGGSLTGSIDNNGAGAVSLTVSGGVTIGGGLTNFGGGTFTAALNGGTIGSTIDTLSSLSIGGATASTFNGDIMNTGITVNSSSTAVINGTTTPTSIVNNGTINNSGAFSLPVGTTSGTGAIVNTAGTIDISSGSIVANAITVNGGSLSVSGAVQSAAITNNATMYINSGASLTSTGAIVNSGTLNLSGDISMPGYNFTNTATVVVSGTRNVTASLYSSSNDTQYFTITNASTADSLNVTGNLDISNDVINVSSTNSTPSTWNIITTTGTFTHNNTQVLLPASSFFLTWSYNFLNKALQISLQVPSFTSQADPGINTVIAGVLDSINTGTKTAAQQELLNAVFKTTNSLQYNDLIHEFMPNNNANAMFVELQNDALDKVSVRVAGIREGIPADATGFSSGELTANTALWQTIFGSIARQNSSTTTFNEGYKSKSGGVLLGLDNICENDDVYGGALGASYTRVTENSNQSFITDITGIHAILYGANIFSGDIFIESMLNAAINMNKGSRYIDVGTGNLSVTSNHTGAMAGVRFNFGKYFNINECFNIAEVNILEYTYLYRPTYTETGSVAALNVLNSGNDNLLTLGAGLRVTIPDSDRLPVEYGELRAIITYDAIEPDGAVTANFLVGSPNFTVTSHTARTALQLGATFAFNLYDSLQLAIDYDLQIRSGYTNR